MKKFMIGMHGKYDDIKLKRDYREDFYGIEVCLSENEKDIEKLIDNTERKEIKIGIHFPLRAGILRLRDPQFLSLDEDERRNAFRYIEEELESCYSWISSIFKVCL